MADLDALLQAALDADLAEAPRRRLLLADVPRAVQASLVDLGRPRDQLESDLRSLARAGHLADWLRAAVRMSYGSARETFQRALDDLMAPAGPPPELVAWLDAQLGRWARDARRIADPARKLAFAQGAEELLASWDQDDATPPGTALTRLYTQAGLPPPAVPTPAQIARADALRGAAHLGRLRQSLADLIRLNQRVISEVLAELAQVAAEVIQPAAPAPAADPAADVRVVIVTALPLEDAAVQVVLGLETEWFSPGPVQRSYHLGRVPAAGGGHHHIALAALPDMANNLAAVVTGHLAHHFPGHRRVILCGIAGGVPRPGESEHDVRLGDVVYSGRGGVVQFDLVKEHPDATASTATATGARRPCSTPPAAWRPGAVRASARGRPSCRWPPGSKAPRGRPTTPTRGGRPSGTPPDPARRPWLPASSAPPSRRRTRC
ncbi:MAG: hypothetical protein R3F43_32365 [bacterium]